MNTIKEMCIICEQKLLKIEDDFCDICENEMRRLNLSPQEYAYEHHDKEI